MVRRVASFLVLGLLFLTPAAYAQLASQTALVGTVSDAGGLVLPGASVVAVNVGTSDTYEATTNAEGDYYIAKRSLGRGRYPLPKGQAEVDAEQRRVLMHTPRKVLFEAPRVRRKGELDPATDGYYSG